MANDLPTDYTDGQRIHGPDVNSWMTAINSKSTFLGRVASQAAMVALAADMGDFCYRTDVTDVYYLTALPATTAGNWATASPVVGAGIGTQMLKGNGSGGFAAAVKGTDYASPFWVNVLDYPGADRSGTTFSDAAFAAAFAALSFWGGNVLAPAGTYKTVDPLPVSQFRGLIGEGKGVTRIKYTGSGTCVVAGGGTVTGLPCPMNMEELTIDGSVSGAGAVGIQLGNATSSRVHNVSVEYFNKSGSVGWLFKNSGSLPYSDRMWITGCEAYYCTDAIIFDGDSGTPGLPATSDYSVFEWYIANNANQNGISLKNGVELVGCRLALRGDFGGAVSGNTAWVLGIDQTGTGGSLILNADFDIAVEANPVPRSDGMAAVGHKTIVMGTASNNCNITGSGVLAFQTGTCAFQGASIHAGSRLGVSGFITDSVLGQMITGDGLAVQGGSQYSVKGSATTALVNGQTISPQVADVQEYLLANGAQSVGAITTGAAGLRARKLRVLWHQPASGAAGTLTLPANVHCIGTLSTTNGATDLMDLTYYPSDDAWYGEIVGSTAVTATKLATARNINGVPFDGTAAITVTDATKVANLTPTLPIKTADYTAAVNDLVLMNGAHTIALPSAPADKSRIGVIKMDSGTLTTVATGGSDVFNVGGGSTTVGLLLQYQCNVFQYSASNGVWYLTSVGVPLSAYDARYLNQPTTGNAATATKLATPVNVDGIPFDGSADILTTQWIGQLSAFTLANQTAAQALFATTAPTNGALSLDIGTYEFECAFGLSSMSSTSGSFGFGIAPAGSGGATFTQAWEALAAKPVGSSVAGSTAAGFFTAANTAIATANTNTAGNAIIKGFLRVTAAGLIIPQVSLGIAAAAVVSAGSYFKIKKVSASATVASVGAWT